MKEKDCFEFLSAYLKQADNRINAEFAISAFLLSTTQSKSLDSIAEILRVSRNAVVRSLSTTKKKLRGGASRSCL